jgi:hypothetical protein
MNKKSIYISLSCLYFDEELIKTILSATNNAKFPKRVYIGLTIIGNYDFYKYILDRTKHIENIQIKFFELEGNIGVGHGRSLAMSLYNNQDYILQVDAHTFFMKDWDFKLINRFIASKMLSRNKLVVLSGVPGGYGYYDKSLKENFWSLSETRYPKFLSDSFFVNKSNITEPIEINGKKTINMIPRFTDANIDVLCKEHGIRKKMFKFYPLNKISAAFIFSDKNFFNTKTLDTKSLFWEEEIVQSINLIHKGFSLVFYGGHMPIAHMYSNDMVFGKGKRRYATDFIEDKDLYLSMAKNWANFLNDEENAIKISRYQEYAKVDLLTGVPTGSLLPRKYNK